jgi:hypothetical protein
MALDSATGSELDIAGHSPSRPVYINKISFDGDAAYATGGSADFQQFVRDVTEDIVTVVDATGYGYTAGALTHFARHDHVNDTLVAFVLAGTEVPNATDLSSVSFELTVTGQ